MLKDKIKYTIALLISLFLVLYYVPQYFIQGSKPLKVKLSTFLGANGSETANYPYLRGRVLSYEPTIEVENSRSQKVKMFDLKEKLPEPTDTQSWDATKGPASLLSLVEKDLVLNSFPYIESRKELSQTLSVTDRILGNIRLTDKDPNPWKLNCTIDNVQKIDANRKFVVTACSPKFERDSFDCHLCSPILSAFVIENAGSPILVDTMLFFNEEGSYGKAPPAFPLKLSLEIPALLFVHGNGNQGYFSAKGYIVAFKDNKLFLLHIAEFLWEDTTGALAPETFEGDCNPTDDICPKEIFSKLYTTGHISPSGFPDLALETNVKWRVRKGEIKRMKKMQTLVIKR